MKYRNPQLISGMITDYKEKVERLMKDKDFYEIANESTKLVVLLGEHRTSAEELHERASSSDVAKLVLDLRNIGIGWQTGNFDQIRKSYEASLLSCTGAVRELDQSRPTPNINLN